MLGSYVDVRLLSKRRHAWIFRGRKVNSGEKVVIKVFSKYNGSFYNELRILKHLKKFPELDFVQRIISHEEWSFKELLSLIDLPSFDSHKTYPVLISHYCGRDIYYALVRKEPDGDKRFTENNKLLAKVLSAADVFARKKLPLLHRVAKVVHCDIKIENITYSPQEDKCYLIDFGSAALLGESTNNSWNERTCPYYTPRFENEIDRDEYAMGLVIYFIAHRGLLPKEEDPCPFLDWVSKTRVGYTYCSNSIFLRN